MRSSSRARVPRSCSYTARYSSPCCSASRSTSPTRRQLQQRARSQAPGAVPGRCPLLTRRQIWHAKYATPTVRPPTCDRALSPQRALSMRRHRRRLTCLCVKRRCAQHTCCLRLRCRPRVLVPHRNMHTARNFWAGTWACRYHVNMPTRRYPPSRRHPPSRQSCLRRLRWKQRQ